MPLISYVVTLYNKETFLPFVLRGLESQRGPFTREFIFVDDGSHDSTVKTLTAMTASWENVTIITQANAGPAIATNAGLARAKGDYIKPLDGDDVLAPLATAAHLHAMDGTGLGVSLSRKVTTYAADHDTPESFMSRFSTDIPEFVKIESPLETSIRRSTVNPSLWMARRDVIERIGPCDPHIFIQDYSIELRLAADGPLAELMGHTVAFPDIAQGRLTDNKAQILHDVSLAAIRFARKAEKLPARYRNIALKRAAKRVVSWKTRHGSGSAFALQIIYLKAMLGLAQPTEDLEAALCRPFREHGKVRIPVVRSENSE